MLPERPCSKGGTNVSSSGTMLAPPTPDISSCFSPVSHGGEDQITLSQPPSVSGAYIAMAVPALLSKQSAHTPSIAQAMALTVWLLAAKGGVPSADKRSIQRCPSLRLPRRPRLGSLQMRVRFADRDASVLMSSLLSLSCGLDLSLPCPPSARPAQYNTAPAVNADAAATAACQSETGQIQPAIDVERPTQLPRPLTTPTMLASPFEPAATCPPEQIGAATPAIIVAARMSAARRSRLPVAVLQATRIPLLPVLALRRSPSLIPRPAAVSKSGCTSSHYAKRADSALPRCGLTWTPHSRVQAAIRHFSAHEALPQCVHKCSAAGQLRTKHQVRPATTGSAVGIAGQTRPPTPALSTKRQEVCAAHERNMVAAASHRARTPALGSAAAVTQRTSTPMAMPRRGSAAHGVRTTSPNVKKARPARLPWR